MNFIVSGELLFKMFILGSIWVYVINNVSVFFIYFGVYFFMGESGLGKSIFINFLVGLDILDLGFVYVEGVIVFD